MMNELQKLYLDKGLLKESKDFLIECLKEMAIDKSFRGEPITGIKEAKEAIEKAYGKLDEMFGEKKKSTRRIVR